MCWMCCVGRQKQKHVQRCTNKDPGVNTTRAQIDKANKFVDELIERKRNTLAKDAGKIQLPDQKLHAYKVFTNIYITLTKGYLDLQDMKRLGDCRLTDKSDVLKLVVDMGLDSFKGAYHYEIKAGIIKKSGILTFVANGIQILLF